MEFRTEIEIQKALFSIEPEDRMLFVGSCFAENIGRLFRENMFRATVNPYGAMYNPASILHTIERAVADGTIPPSGVDTAVFTLGTNHVYVLKQTGEIVDNCRKRPQKLFNEVELSVDECTDYLRKVMERLRSLNPSTKVIITVSPIRYAKYGYHGSQLSKATLLLAAEKAVRQDEGGSIPTTYFPAYEILCDELRDYRFYAPDMLHPSEQAVEFIYERFAATFFSGKTHQMIKEWQPVKAALNHRPFNPESEEYKTFLAKAEADRMSFLQKWGLEEPCCQDAY